MTPLTDKQKVDFYKAAKKHLQEKNHGLCWTMWIVYNGLSPDVDIMDMLSSKGFKEWPRNIYVLFPEIKALYPPGESGRTYVWPLNETGREERLKLLDAAIKGLTKKKK